MGEAANHVVPVELLFDAKTGEAARATREELRAATMALRAADVPHARDSGLEKIRIMEEDSCAERSSTAIRAVEDGQPSDHPSTERSPPE